MDFFNNIMGKAFKVRQEDTKYSRMTLDGIKAKLGASDIALCARKAAYDVIVGSKSRTLSEFFRMSKGNIAEGVVEQNLDTLSVPYERQGEYTGKGTYDFMVVHPDILIKVQDLKKVDDPEVKKWYIYALKNKYKYLLVELKTTNGIPVNVHDYWEKQTNIQMDIIAQEIGIEPEEIGTIVYAIELNDGNTKEFPIKYDLEVTTLALEEAMFCLDVIQDYFDWSNGDKENREFEIQNVPRRVGSACMLCDHTDDCLSKTEAIELEDNYNSTLEYIAKYNAEKKNIDKNKGDIKNLLLKLGAKKAFTKDFEVSLRGGNKKKVIDPSKFSDKEKLEIAKKLPDYISVSAKLDGAKVPKDMEWINSDDKYIDKTTSVSMIIKDKKG